MGSQPRFNGHLFENKVAFYHLRGQVNDHVVVHCLELQRRGTLEVFEVCCALLADVEPVHRAIGAEVLGALGHCRGCFHDESVQRLIGLLKDSDSDVIGAAAFALGHRNDAAAIPHLLPLVDHPDPYIRLGVVMGLSCHDDLDAAEGLIRLSDDSECDIRNWATFGLGSQTECDTPAIRRALRVRLQDEVAQIRGEAILGLALRGEGDLMPHIIQALEDFQGIWPVEAVTLVPDPAYIPMLFALLESLCPSDRSRFADEFKQAIAACGGTIYRE